MKEKKSKKQKEDKFPSELRLDLVSRDWVVIATGRARRPETFKEEKKEKRRAEKKKCPFCKITSQENPTLVFVKGKKYPLKDWSKLPSDWSLVVVPNKYPAFLPYPKLEKRVEGGIYQKVNAVGYHEVVITRDHKKDIDELPREKIKEVFDAYQERYLALKDKRFVNHIFIFHNHGPKAGASIAHPHSQIITTPHIDTDLENALSRAEQYFKEKKHCVYCRMNKWEIKSKKRIVYENEEFVAVCPFASKTAFQVIISPKKHLSYFEEITEKEKKFLADAFYVVFRKINKGLNNPDYNFYLHSAPCDGKDHNYYHWHWTILPKTSVWAGFEVEARMEISTIEPEEAAKYLRSIKV